MIYKEMRIISCRCSARENTGEMYGHYSANLEDSSCSGRVS